MALAPDGAPRFELLQRGEVPVTYVVFDVLSVDGRSTIGLPYEDRRRLLADLVDAGDHWIVPAHHIGGGEELLQAARDRGLEGVMAKRLGSTYQPGKRSPAWRKVKVRREQEVVIGGWTQGTGNREDTFGSVLVGYYEDGPLRFAGGVGTGFDRTLLESLLPSSAASPPTTCPFDPPPPPAVRRTAHWVRPELVCEMAFAEWTFDGIVRQASFLGPARRQGTPRRHPRARRHRHRVAPLSRSARGTDTVRKRHRCVPGTALRTAGESRSQRPVWPKPPPRSAPSSAATSTSRHASTRCTTSWAMRSPRCTSYG